MRIRIPNEFLDQFNLSPCHGTHIEMEFRPDMVVLFAVQEIFGVEAPIQVVPYLTARALVAEIEIFAAATGMRAELVH